MMLPISLEWMGLEDFSFPLYLLSGLSTQLVPISLRDVQFSLVSNWSI